MIRILKKKEIENYLLEASAFASECALEMSLRLYPRFYKSLYAYQITFTEADGDLMKQLPGVLPEAPPDFRITAVFEMTNPVTLEMIEGIRTWTERMLGGDALARFVPVYPYCGKFPTRLTLIYHPAQHSRAFFSSAATERQHLHDVEKHIAKTLNGELKRNEEIGVDLPIEKVVVDDIMYGHYFLWMGIANSDMSATDVVEKLRPDMELVKNEFHVSGMLLFVEKDKGITTVDEIKDLVFKLMDVSGGGDTNTTINIRCRDSLNKYISCRAVLVGNRRYVPGTIYKEFGYYKYILYESENREKGKMVAASIGKDEFILSRFEWGMYQHNMRGQTEDHYFFNRQETAQLSEALHVKRPEALLRTIRRRFATATPHNCDNLFLDFCRRKGLNYTFEHYF